MSSIFLLKNKFVMLLARHESLQKNALFFFYTYRTTNLKRSLFYYKCFKNLLKFRTGSILELGNTFYYI